MRFPADDRAWSSVATFLAESLGEGASILAPNEFHEIFPLTYPYDVSRQIDVTTLDALVIHKGALSEVGKEICNLLLRDGIPLFGNEVFVVFSLKGPPRAGCSGHEHFRSFQEMAGCAATFKSNPAKAHSEFSGPSTVILMTTYNRPHMLAGSLETIRLLKAPVLVVNDGSSPEHREAYERVTQQFGVRVLDLPGNRGLSAAMNAGLSYWLADPMVEWICYLQDDVEVRADLLKALSLVQDRNNYPLLSGRHNPLHKVYGQRTINGCDVLLQRMSPGIHLHAHRDYWEKMLPIPTAYFQAPRRWPDLPLRGADEDWWISQWSPKSIVKQGGYIAVLPGLVRTTAALAAESTWENPGEVDLPLPAPVWSTKDYVPAVPTATIALESSPSAQERALR
jgi:hypothetical protein